MKPTKKLPLFIVTGASGVGKSTICEALFTREEKYIVLESDILWNEHFNQPETDYRAYREVWLRMCNNISQIGLPVVLCGCSIPKQFEICDERAGFSALHYLAVVTDEATLLARMKNGRHIQDESWLKSSVDFNNWLKNNASQTTPTIQLLDYTNISIEQAAAKVDEWINRHI